MQIFTDRPEHGEQGQRVGSQATSVSVLGGVVLGRHHQAPALAGSSVNSFYDVNHLLFILHGPVDLVVVTCAQIDHDVLVPFKGEKEQQTS